MASAARTLLDQGKYADSLTQAQKALASASDTKAKLEALEAVLLAHVAKGDLDAALKAAETEQQAFASKKDPPGQAGSLRLVGMVHLAKEDPDDALASAKEGIAVAKREGLTKVEAELSKVMVDAYAMKDLPKEALKTANEALASAKGKSDTEAEALSWMAMTVAYAAQDKLDPSSTAGDFRASAQKAANLYNSLKDTEGEALALTKQAGASFILEDYKDAMSLAKDAVSTAKSAGKSRILSEALDKLVDTQIALGSPSLGIDAAKEELEVFESAGNKKGTVDVLKTLVHAYETIEEPLSALLASKNALEIYRELGDTSGEANMMYMTAVVQCSKGSFKEALKMAKDAMQIYSVLGSDSGKEKVNEVLSQIYFGLGEVEKAPNRGKAFQALRDLMRAVLDKDVEAYKKADTKLGKYMFLITEEEFWGGLMPAFSRDREGSIEFMTAQGYNFEEGKKKEEETTPGAEKFSCKDGRHFDHTLFYFQTRVFGGMGFGPQFRSVNPYRYGTPGVNGTAISATQLDETEDWELKLHWRPGVLDSGLQQIGSLYTF